MIWTTKENNFLKELYPEGSKEIILSKINRPWPRIIAQACKLHIKRNIRSDSWTSIEKLLLQKIYENNTKEFIIKTFKKTDFNRSWQSIRKTAISLKLKRNPEITKQEMIEGGKNAPTPSNIILWTEEDDNKFHSIYANGTQKEIMVAFPNRTWKAIREQANGIGLSRNKETISKDRALHLKENFGVTSNFQLKSVREKSRLTNIEKRGVEYALQSPEVRALIKKTVQERYGVDNVFQAEKFKEKAKQSLYNRGTQKCSRQQKHIANLLNGEINYPIGNCNVDVLLENSIICEYDGGGHDLTVKLGTISKKDFIKKERRREIFLKLKGFQTIKIISKNDLLPSDTVLLKMISEGIEYLKTGHSWISFDIDKGTVKCIQYSRKYSFEKLRRLRKGKYE